MNLRTFRAVVALTALLITNSAFGTQSDSLQCERGIVSVGNVMAEVVAKCGDPTFTNSYQASRGDRPEFWTITINDWTYNFGPDRFMYHLVFENGRVVRIDSLRRGD